MECGKSQECLILSNVIDPFMKLLGTLGLTGIGVIDQASPFEIRMTQIRGMNFSGYSITLFLLEEAAS